MTGDKKAGTIDALLQQLPMDAVGRGAAFERLCVWYLRNDPRYRRLLRAVWPWKDWPDRSGPDTGIDVVAESFDGEIWAVQCKGYSISSTVTKRDIDTFLAESGRPPFKRRMLIASTDSVSVNAARTMEAQDPPVLRVQLGDLLAAEVSWPRTWAEFAATRPQPKEPLPHQAAAVDAVVRGLEHSDRGQLVMACGTGKTLVALWVHERLDCQATLVLVPSLSLLAQALREWTANATSDFAFQAVCSDDSVSDGAISQVSTLGVPTTTSPSDIRRFMARPRRRVIFSTYQSSERVAEALDGTDRRFDLVVADEAHRTTGRTGGAFATVLSVDSLPARRRLFMTATPRFYTERVRQTATAEGSAVASMDDLATYGPILHRLGFSEAVARGLLSDYRVVIVGVTDAQYRQWVSTGRLVTTDTAHVTDARSLAGQLALAKVMRDYDLKRVITFHSRVKEARTFADELPSVFGWLPKEVAPLGTTWAGHVSGRMSTARRYRQLSELSSPTNADRAVLSNAQCLSEGVDVPALDGVAFIDPRRSQVDIIQAVGRVMRRSPHKTVGTILLPVFVPDDVEAENAVAASAFKHVWSVVRALRAHDDALGEELDELRRQMGPRGAAGEVRVPDKIVVDLPTQVPESFIHALSLRVVLEASSPFEGWLGLLAEYVAVHGDARVLGAYVSPGGDPLGTWVSTQRALRNSGSLSEDRQRALESFHGWTWDVRAEEWDEGLSHVRAYVEEFEHAAVPQHYKAADGFPTGRWVQSRRLEFSNGKLDEGAVKQLEALPGWRWQVGTGAWEAMFEELLRYLQDHSSVDVPQRFVTPAGRRLGDWVARQHRDKRRGLLKAARAARLESLPGWSWRTGASVKSVDREVWNSWFDCLRDYLEHHDGVMPPQKAVHDGRRVGQWVSQQRLSWRQGFMPDDLGERLAQLPGWEWDSKAAKWDRGYRRMSEFARQNQHCRVPPGLRFDDVGDLASWARSQRKQRATRSISAERAELLESLPGWWWFGDVGRGNRLPGPDDAAAQGGPAPDAGRP